MTVLLSAQELNPLVTCSVAKELHSWLWFVFHLYPIRSLAHSHRPPWCMWQSFKTSAGVCVRALEKGGATEKEEGKAALYKWWKEQRGKEIPNGFWDCWELVVLTSCLSDQLCCLRNILHILLFFKGLEHDQCNILKYVFSLFTPCH